MKNNSFTTIHTLVLRKKIADIFKKEVKEFSQEVNELEIELNKLKKKATN